MGRRALVRAHLMNNYVRACFRGLESGLATRKTSSYDLDGSQAFILESLAVFAEHPAQGVGYFTDGYQRPAALEYVRHQILAPARGIF